MSNTTKKQVKPEAPKSTGPRIDQGVLAALRSYPVFTGSGYKDSLMNWVTALHVIMDDLGVLKEEQARYAILKLDNGIIPAYANYQVRKQIIGTSTLEDLEEYLMTTYGKILSKLDYSWRLNNIQYKGNIEEFNAEFSLLAEKAGLNRNNPDTIYHYIFKLPEEAQLYLCKEELDTLDKAMNKASIQLRAIAGMKKLTPIEEKEDPDAMDIDFVSFKKNPDKHHRHANLRGNRYVNSSQPIQYANFSIFCTQGEFECCRSNNQCLCCGREGHKFFKCQLYKMTRPPINTINQVETEHLNPEDMGNQESGKEY
ncbi:hypothetical protein H4219_006092 [Mycoemilia scoparia]|uniref:Uncharacterized protein n=1 Tax=Mycoemilia scoparia TaxID=417184 RepID=A0A9W7ZLP5_9FUNG|nr:hypothetical protein H4219_006092 [Mycoemilia scoparia]